MNKQELIERIEGLKNIFWNECEYVKIDFMLELVSELDEPEAGHADEAPRYVKNILARLRELPLHDREVCLKTIMGEFEQDFSRAKWREGYEQGKLEGAMEREKVIVPQLVADWISFVKTNGLKFKNTYGFYEEIAPSDDVYRVMYYIFKESIADKEIRKWVCDNIDTFARAWLDGYEVEKEKQYEVLLCNGQSLKTVYRQGGDRLDFEKVYGDLERFTRKQLEDAGLGWAFDCQGIEIREVAE